MKVRINNIGGISNPLDIELSKGVNLYNAPNAYGKTSLARALVSMLTSEIKPEDLLNVFADSGYVEVRLNDKEYYRRIRRVKNKLVESAKLIMDDSRALLLSYFSPENKLLNQILGGQENIEWFISATSEIEKIKQLKVGVEEKLKILKEEHEELKNKYKDAVSIQAEIRNIENEIESLKKEKESDRLINSTTQSISVTRQNKLLELNSKIEQKKKELVDLQSKHTKLELEIQQKELMIKPEIKKIFEDQINQINEELQRKSSLRNEAEIGIRLLERVLDEIKEAEKNHSDTCYVCGSHVDPSNWKVRVDVITGELRMRQNSFESIKKEIDELNRKKEELQRKLGEFENVKNEVARLKQKKQELLSRMEMVKEQISDLERQRREMEDRFNKTSDLIRISGPEDAVSKRIQELMNKKNQLEYELSTLGIPASTLNKIKEKEKEIEELEKQAENLQQEYIKRLTVAKEEFTRVANSLLKELDFNLEAEITPNYTLTVKRSGTFLDLKKLSSSERTTLALILVVTALKSYFKTPFFIVDESFMTFDQRRLQKLVEYLNGITDYVIITRSDDNINIVREEAETQVTTS
ncbi:hypothetical protein MetMK1DRAFT_00012990 [Metallosphaera yellowstonensis MK1]|uniref:Zinc-hook domain-containing protein n=1 Tax=Metallosphaera yellowstonensis MK1 TaxID=671065 RepID=H2C3H5_9CREN|nr:archaea-specific SMC-related protein [Metallosphaera yellowstonensis]EHP70796.1 hypothetical protein MetMK1DRAFT_00012990 [Metallosphaera yellowstonensis MK1]